LRYFLFRDDRIHIIAIEDLLPNLITTAWDLPEVDIIQRVIGTSEVVGEVSFA
jgi:hypothetical protein